MSLTTHINNLQSPLRCFIEENFPCYKQLQQGVQPLLLSATTQRPENDVDWSVIGTALDYRVRFDFKPHTKMVAHGGAAKLRGKRSEIAGAFFGIFDERMNQLQPHLKILNDSEEEELARYCFALALYEQLYRTIYPNRLVTSSYDSPFDVLAFASQDCISDIVAVYRQFRDKLSYLLIAESVILNPTFTGSIYVGGADADLILDGCLIDIKSTINPRLPKYFIQQLIGYTLLDLKDKYKIDSVGILYIRQGLLVKWTLEEIFHLTEHPKIPTDISSLRDDFWDVLDEIVGPKMAEVFSQLR